MTEVRDPWFREVVDPIEELLERWRSRSDNHLVDGLLPAWRGNSGLTDGWADVLTALRSVEHGGGLPDDEMATIVKVARRIERAIHRT